jgi:hypothetical protein
MSQVEEYQKGSDYAPIFKKRFNDGVKGILRKNEKNYCVSWAKNCYWGVIDKKNTWLNATKQWFLDNGWEIKK